MLKRANENNSHAQYCIGSDYSYGWIVEKDKKEANRWYQFSYQS